MPFTCSVETPFAIDRIVQYVVAHWSVGLFVTEKTDQRPLWIIDTNNV